MARVLVTQEFIEAALAEFEGSGLQVDVRPEPEPMPAEELVDALHVYEGVVCLLTDRIDRPLLEANPQLRVVANCAVGFDNIDVQACTQAGVLVSNTPDVLTDATADLAFALMLSTARRVPEGDAFLRAGRYRYWRLRQEQLGLDVFGQTLGVFGLGKIGKAVAQRAWDGFHMTVLYHDARRAAPDEEQRLGVEFVGMDELLGRSDFVSLHAPLTPATHHAFGEQQFAKMKRSAILINTARGPLVDEAALVGALRQGEIRGAGLDVYEQEPDVHPQLLALRDSVVLLPHLGSATERTREQMARMAARNVREALAGNRPPNLVNEAAYSGPFGG